MTLLLAVWTWLAVQPPAGRIVGHVIDVRSGAPLAAVLVKVQATGQQALTDAEGAFEIVDVPAGPHTLIVSAVGFGLVRRDVLVAADRAVDVTLLIAEGGSAYVEDVTVTGLRLPRDEPGVASQRVLGARDLLALRGVIADDPFRAVHVMPSVATSDDFQAQFAVRAQGPAHIGIGLDGIDSPLLFHTVRGIDDTGSLALINSDILDSATLLSGAYPQRLAAHTGARVDFTTREPARDRLTARALFSATAATTVWEGPLASGARGAWLVAARRSYIDWLLRKIDPEIEGTFGFGDLQAKLVLNPSPRHTIQTSFIGGRAQLHEDDSRPSVNSLDRGRTKVGIGNVRWLFTPGARLALTNQAYIVEGRYRNTVPDGRTREEGLDREVTWRGTAQLALGDSAETLGAGLLEVGGQTQWFNAIRVRRRFTATASSSTLDRRGTTNAQAAWVNVRWTPRPSLTFTPGARVEHFSLVDRVVASPWVLMEWQTSHTTTVRASGGAAHQSPAFEQTAFPIPDSIGGAPTSPPRPEQAITADLGAEQRVGETWRLSLTGYYRRDNHGFRSEVDDFKLVAGRLAGPTAAVWANTLTGNAAGLELTLDRRAVNGISGWVSYGYGHARTHDSRTGESYDGDYDQTHMVNAYATYRVSGRTSVSSRLRYGSNFPIQGYFARGRRRVLRDDAEERRAAARLRAARSPRRTHVHLSPQPAHAVRRDAQCLQSAQRLARRLRDQLRESRRQRTARRRVAVPAVSRRAHRVLTAGTCNAPATSAGT